MKKIMLLFCLMPLLVYAQSSKQANLINEDRVKVIINDEARLIETRLSELQEKKLEVYQQEFDQRAKFVEQKLDSVYLIGGIIAALLAGGVLAVLAGAIRFAKNYAERRIKEEVDFAVYRLDPRRWKIHIPRHNFDTERKRLEALKYRDLVAYDGLTKECREGITVYRATSDEDLKRLKAFMDDEKIDPFKCCFVIYYTEQPRLNTQLLSPFDNFVVANMPSTLSSQIFAASRNIVYGD